MPQSALTVKNPPEQSKAHIQPKKRPARATRNRWKKPIVGNDCFPPFHEAWDKEDWDRVRKWKLTENQKENNYLHHHGELAVLQILCLELKPKWVACMFCLDRITLLSFRVGLWSWSLKA